LRIRSTVVTVGIAMAVAGCGSNGKETADAIDVRGAEYAFVMPDEGKAGVVRFNISNTGKEFHEFALGRLEEGKTLADVQAFLKSGQNEPPDWFRDVAGVPLLSPGEEVGITRELEKGTYVFLCFVPSPTGAPHVNLGMLKAFELSGDSGRELPEPDAVVTARSGGYDIPPISAGPQTLELRNSDDTEREFFLLALKPGKNIGDVDRFFEKSQGKGEPPATFHGAMQTIPPGTSVFLDIDLEAGVEYTLTDTSGGAPIVAKFTPQ
jgi:uncharacterized cupredoxin-like copper-binding protein